MENQLTIRQQIVRAMTGTLSSAHQLARLVDIREREVEEHLAHIIKTIGRDRTREFLLEPPRCVDCGYGFRGRTRLTTPSRCPECKSEGVSPPRFGIKTLNAERED